MRIDIFHFSHCESFGVTVLDSDTRFAVSHKRRIEIRCNGVCIKQTGVVAQLQSCDIVIMVASVNSSYSWMYIPCVNTAYKLYL
jgi:4-hydroxy-3-methylbut-2-enyl diphosphate reductase IspH